MYKKSKLIDAFDGDLRSPLNTKIILREKKMKRVTNHSIFKASRPAVECFRIEIDP
jgi:hypothetical protein